jgi:DNA-binding transcriptional LysR family regulator
MKLQQLKYVVKVAELGNITEASRRLFVSQPSITAAIHDLENEMGVVIFSRTNKGVEVTRQGELFLGYARQVLEQADLLEEKFKGDTHQAPHFAVSCQHYSFAVNAFVDVIREFDAYSYDFTLREEQTHEIIEDVARMKSELGILYLSPRNEEVIRKMLRNNELDFEPLFTAAPHVFISSAHPLAKRESISIEDLADYPYLSYEQGNFNSFYFSEELLSTLDRRKNIRVRDRATLFNLLIGLDGYTVCSGVISHELNGKNIIAVPLEEDTYMTVGVITRKNTHATRYGKAYKAALLRHIPSIRP